MTNLYRRNNTRSTPVASVFAVVVTLVAVLFGFDYVTGGVVREYVRGAGGAAHSLVASAGTSITESGFFSSKSALARENDVLRRDMARYAENIALAEYVREENAMLREMARVAGEESGITVRVLSSLQRSPYGTFVIDAGTNDGVYEGAVVLTEGGFLLGTVTTASHESATVQSLFAPGREVDLIVNEHAFVAEGRGGGNARAEVPRESELAAGDVVTAAAYGRPAGSILHIESASSSAIAILSIRIPINFDTLRFLYVTR